MTGPAGAGEPEVRLTADPAAASRMTGAGTTTGDPAAGGPVAGAPVAGSSAVVDGVDLDEVAAAVRGCPGVDDLCAGDWDRVVSYLPGRRLAGVRLTPERVEISVRSRWGVPAPDLARQIRSVLAGLTGGRETEVIVADVADPGWT